MDIILIQKEMELFNKIFIIVFTTLCFSSMKTDSNNIGYIKNEINAINLKLVNQKSSSSPIYLGGNNKTVSITEINQQIAKEMNE